MRRVTDRRALPGLSMIRIARRTFRRSHCVALPVRAVARLQPAEAAGEAPANSRTSSSTPVGRLPCGRLAHNYLSARLRSWASIWFAPRRVTRSRAMRSREWQIRASSSVSLAKHPPAPSLLNRIGQRMSIAVIWFRGERKPSCQGADSGTRRQFLPEAGTANQPLLKPAKGPRIPRVGWKFRPVCSNASFERCHRYHE